MASVGTAARGSRRTLLDAGMAHKGAVRVCLPLALAATANKFMLCCTLTLLQRGVHAAALGPAAWERRAVVLLEALRAAGYRPAVFRALRQPTFVMDRGVPVRVGDPFDPFQFFRPSTAADRRWARGPASPLCACANSKQTLRCRASFQRSNAIIASTGFSGLHLCERAEQPVGSMHAAAVICACLLV